MSGYSDDVSTVSGVLRWNRNGKHSNSLYSSGEDRRKLRELSEFAKESRDEARSKL